MKRSAHVTIAAIAMFAASALLLISTSITSIEWFMLRPAFTDFPMGEVRVVIDACVLIFIGLGVWGVVAAVGVLRLRQWARKSALMVSIVGLLLPVLAQVLILATLFALARRNGSAGFEIEAPRLTFTWDSFFLALPIWWLILFTRPSVKAQFVGRREGSGEGGEE